MSHGDVGTGHLGAEPARLRDDHPGAEVTVVHDPHHASPVAEIR